MKDFFKVDLECPYCHKTFQYNIISYKARCECPHCEYNLIVRTKMSMMVFLSIFGFILLGMISQILGLSRFGDLFNLIYWIVGCLLYVAASSYTVGNGKNTGNKYGRHQDTAYERRKSRDCR